MIYWLEPKYKKWTLMNEPNRDYTDSKNPNWTVALEEISEQAFLSRSCAAIKQTRKYRNLGRF